VSFAAITLCVASQQVFIVGSVYFVMTESGNFWIRPRTVLLPVLELAPFCKVTASITYEDVSKSFRTGRLERELRMVQLYATRCSCIAIL
jgi:hypothetical protein